MTVQLCSLNSYYHDYWADDIQQEHLPVSFQPSERLNAGKNPSHPEIIFSPLHGVIQLTNLIRKNRFCYVYSGSTSTSVLVPSA
ncbi:MAG: hypothetical protein PHZ02_05490 [Desulfocapsaceae bacterium]|nr:hypothetical protein [Desulfocapsaceae bacterium]